MEKDFLERLVKNESQTQTNTDQIKEHDQRIERLERNTAILEKMDLRMGNVESSLKEIKTDIQNKKEQKGMKWDKLIDYLFYAILAYALFKLGLR